MNRSVAAKIVSNENAYVRTVEASPEPGQYQQETVTFAKNMNKVDFGSKYQFKADSNPAVVQYEVEASAKATMNRSVAAKIVSNENAYKRPVEESPDPGQYQ